jgi:hypothetical protein
MMQRLKSLDFDFSEQPLQELVLTSIRVPPALIDNFAELHGITANLSHVASDL